jgi:hypothetical protein
MDAEKTAFFSALAASLALHAGLAILPGLAAQAPREAPSLGAPNISLLAAKTATKSTESSSSQEVVGGSKSNASSRHAIIHADEYYHAAIAAPYEEPDLSSMICDGKDSAYEGVGMIIQPGSNLVISAPPQYPAYKAGIRKGDRIVDPYGPAAKHGVVDFQVETRQSLRTVRIRLAKICFRSKP